ncbi:MAG TPA: hypothetical protein PKE57_00080 [Cellvibrionaceae bacterium]|nr:hypothetical protein [Cellvibrionaceae bacterium]HMW48242.1 hypothetical protein [Cellvibrionaceae bacterium]HMW70536.1 hypothetical protein [Cellvibrionaceae bacterium]HNG59086.1 hypothetical protein [Cellvibrionaceae bacterium]
MGSISALFKADGAQAGGNYCVSGGLRPIQRGLVRIARIIRVRVLENSADISKRWLHVLHFALFALFARSCF